MKIVNKIDLGSRVVSDTFKGTIIYNDCIGKSRYLINDLYTNELLWIDDFWLVKVLQVNQLSDYFKKGDFITFKRYLNGAIRIYILELKEFKVDDLIYSKCIAILEGKYLRLNVERYLHINFQDSTFELSSEEEVNLLMNAEF